MTPEGRARRAAMDTALSASRLADAEPHRRHQACDSRAPAVRPRSDSGGPRTAARRATSPAVASSAEGVPTAGAQRGRAQKAPREGVLERREQSRTAASDTAGSRAMQAADMAVTDLARLVVAAIAGEGRPGVDPATGMRREELAGLRWGDWNRDLHRMSNSRTGQVLAGRSTEFATKSGRVDAASKSTGRPNRTSPSSA